MVRRRPTVILYLGPGRSGKTASLRALARGAAPAAFAVPDVPGAAVETLALTGPGDRPLELVAAPGRLLCSRQRRRLLTAADGVVFVADARRARQDANLVHLDELGRHLLALGWEPGGFPLVLQIGHLDAPDALPAAALQRRFAPAGAPVLPARPDTGDGVASVLAALLDRLAAAG